MRQVYEYDPLVGYRFIPNIKARIMHPDGGYLIRTNGSGFQCDHEFTSKKREGTRRILLFGDSFTTGEGVSSGYRFSDCLEKMIPGLEIFNMGLPASGTDQHYLIYRERSQGLEHDLLMIAVFVENIRRVASRYRHWGDKRGRPVIYAKPYFLLREGKLELCGVPPQKMPLQAESLRQEERRYIATTSRFPRLKSAFNQARGNRVIGRLFSNGDLKDHVLKLMRYQPMKEYNDPENPGWLVMRAILEHWINGHHKPVVLVPIPLFHYVAGISDSSSYLTRLREVTEASGGHFLDPLQGMRQPSLAASRAMFLGDGHLNRRGHQILADALAPALTEMLQPMGVT